MSKDHAYAYEAGYRDGSVHYELEHCPACKNVADLQEALEENAKLRQQLADVTESMGRVGERCAKLRELVQDMRKAFIHNACYRWCEHMPEPCNGACQYLRRMRELGIEVDG